MLIVRHACAREYTIIFFQLRSKHNITGIGQGTGQAHRVVFVKSFRACHGRWENKEHPPGAIMSLNFCKVSNEETVNSITPPQPWA